MSIAEIYVNEPKAHDRARLARVLSHAILLTTAVFMLLPLVWMIMTSVKTEVTSTQIPPQWIPDPFVPENYLKVFNELPFVRFFLNTVFVAIAITLGQLVMCATAAYVFARLEFPGKNLMFILVLATMMIPIHLYLIPSFILMNDLKWYDRYEALIIPNIFSPFGIFLLRQFFLGIPRELEEAARLDGAGYIDVFTKVVLPLSVPALAALAAVTFLYAWNSFIWPLIMISSDQYKVLSVGLTALQGRYVTNWPVLMAGATLAMLPTVIVYIAAQKYFVRGITLSGFGGR